MRWRWSCHRVCDAASEARLQHFEHALARLGSGGDDQHSLQPSTCCQEVMFNPASFSGPLVYDSKSVNVNFCSRGGGGGEERLELRLLGLCEDVATNHLGTLQQGRLNGSLLLTLCNSLDRPLLACCVCTRCQRRRRACIEKLRVILHTCCIGSLGSACSHANGVPCRNPWATRVRSAWLSCESEKPPSLICSEMVRRQGCVCSF